MKTSLFLLLFGFCSTAIAQHATVTLLADSSAGKTIYLKRFHAPGLDYDIVDSAKVVNGVALFHIVPDPMKEYELVSGRDYIADDIYLADGDSLVFNYGPKPRKLSFDRTGANKMFRDSSNRPKSQWDFYHGMEKLTESNEGIDWDAECAYSNEYVARMKASAARLEVRYPEHTGIQVAMRGAERRWYYEPRFRYYYKYFGSDSIPMDPVDIQRTSVLDSVPWNDSLFEKSDEIEYLASEWLNIKEWYYRRAGIDTSGKSPQLQSFEFALHLPSPARDAAVLSTITDLLSVRSDSAIAKGERELVEYKRLSPDEAYLQKFESTLNSIRIKLPGKSAPEFSLPDISGHLVSLKNFRGKTVYLDFWGTWCQPCREELFPLQDLEKKFKDDTSVVFLSIGLEASSLENQTFEAWKQFITDNSLSGIHLYADNQWDNEYVHQYGIQSVPTFMIIDANGNFVDSSAPRPSSGKAEQAIRDAVARKNN